MLYLHIAAHGIQDLGHGCFDPGGNRERGCVSALEHTEQGTTYAILPNDVFLRHIAVADLRHVAYRNYCSADIFHRQVVQEIDPERANVDIDRNLFASNLGYAARKS